MAQKSEEHFAKCSSLGIFNFYLKSTYFRTSQVNSNISDTGTVVKQCELLEANRSSYYYEPVAESEENLSIIRLLDEQYFKTPFYGLERLLVLFILKGYKINRKRLKRLMKIQGWKTLYCKPRNTRIDSTAYEYPYLLRGLAIEITNQVWEIDITYLAMKNGFM